MTRLPFRLAILAAGIAFAFSAAAGDAQTAPANPAIAKAGMGGAALASGIDRKNMDTGVRPQDDVFAAINGQWVKSTEIPADKSSYGSFVQLRDLSDERVRTLVEALVAKPQGAGSSGQKVADYYRSYLDVAAIDKAGLAPIEPGLKEIDACADADALLQLMGRLQGIANTPMGVAIQPDFDNPKIYAVMYAQGGLGMGDRDYYLKTDEAFAKKREAYVAYLGKLFALSGDAQSAEHAKQVMELETKIAKVQWAQADLRDPKKQNNPKTPAQLAELAPGVDWNLYAAGAHLPAGGTVIVNQPDYTAALTGLMKSEPLATWKLYLKARRLDDNAQVLPVAFRDAAFDFHGKAMQGQQQQRARWQKGMDELNGNLGEAVGQLYVAKYFPPEYKARMQGLVANLMKAYAGSIDQLTWMSPETKKAAHEKLSKYAVKIGYPDHWRDYSKLEVRPGDAFGNSQRASDFEYMRNVVRIGKPVDRTEWGMNPQTVNAYYDPFKNEIVFPAAILQPPFFDPKADDAANYGGIGAVIGHEISHGFDDEGSQFDGDGKLRNWWTDADHKAFESITEKLVAQYSSYEPIQGQHLNGKLTLGENIADLSGLQISYKAYKLSLGGKPAPVIDGLSGDQRFYFGFAQVWRVKTREEKLLQAIVTDPHSPGRFRAIGASVNADGFHEAFGTKPGDGMWKSPEERIHLW